MLVEFGSILATATCGDSKLFSPSVAYYWSAFWYVSNLQLHKELKVPYLTKLTRILAKNFESKIPYSESLLVQQLGRYLPKEWVITHQHLYDISSNSNRNISLNPQMSAEDIQPCPKLFIWSLNITQSKIEKERISATCWSSTSLKFAQGSV